MYPPTSNDVQFTHICTIDLLGTFQLAMHLRAARQPCGLKVEGSEIEP